MIKTINISKERVYLSIDSRTQKLSDIALTGVVADRVASDINEGLDSNILSRYVIKRDARLRKRLAFCIVNEDLDVVDDSVATEDTLTYVLDIDKEKSINLKGIAQLIHEYLVNGSIADWLLHSGVNVATSFSSDADELEGDIVDMVRSTGIIKPQTLIFKEFGRRR